MWKPDVNSGTPNFPAPGNATPMTYAVDGKQYLVIAAGGHQNIPEEPLGDAVVAFALP